VALRAVIGGNRNANGGGVVSCVSLVWEGRAAGGRRGQ
jgi:hypothetical protein